MIHRLFATCSCVGTSRAIVCVSKPLEVSSAQRRSLHLSHFRRQWWQRNCRVWLQHRRSDPNSTAILFQCIWCQFTAECFVQQAASPSFAWRQSFYWSGFHTPLAVPISTVFDPAFGPKYLPCSYRESRGPRRRLDGCKGINHTRSPSCAKGRTARLPTFRSYAVLPSRPTANRACWLHTAQATSTNHGQLLL